MPLSLTVCLTVDPSQFLMSSEDRAALVALFRSTGGTRWNGKGNWDTDADLSQWHGVQVNNDGRVVYLVLISNNLRGSIPEALGALTELESIIFAANKLTGERGWHRESSIHFAGSIPASLGSLKKLERVVLSRNGLVGPIPEALGALKNVTFLFLDNNKITGPIPTCLGSLSKLQHVRLGGNQLVGHVPKELGNLENLRELHLENNHLTGVIPTELADLSVLSTFNCGNTGLKAFLRRGNKLTGGPAKGEELGSWRERIRPKQKTKCQTLKGDQRQEDPPVSPPSTPPVLLPQQQQTGEGDEKEEDAAAPNRRQDAVRESASSPEHASLSPEKAEEVDRLFQAQLSSSAGLDSLIRENPEAMEDIQGVLEAQVTGSFSPDDERSDMGRRRKLGTSSPALGEVVVTPREKTVPEPDEEPSEDMDVAGRQALGRRLAMSESAERFLGRSRDTAAEHQPVTISELREFDALQTEKHREHEARLKELEGKSRKAAR
ncbi:unnamed protein product [Ectocarpus sp. 13 AM-2016]